MNSLPNSDEPRDRCEFVSNLDIVRQIEFFSGAPMEMIKLVAFTCQRHSYRTGEIIFPQDEDDGAAYYILSGKAALSLERQGRNYRIKDLDPGVFIGGLSLMVPVVKAFSLVALEDLTCIVMTRKAFTKVAEQFPDILPQYFRVFAKKLVLAEKKSIQKFISSEQEEVKDLLGFSLV